MHCSQQTNSSWFLPSQGKLVGWLKQRFDMQPVDDCLDCLEAMLLAAPALPPVMLSWAERAQQRSKGATAGSMVRPESDAS